MSWLALWIGFGCGGLVGFMLGLVGGGGSILAVPLMVYVVGVGDAHTAIGTSALAVAASAASNLLVHARAGRVRLAIGSTFTAAGIAGAWLGAGLGQRFDGQRLLLLSAVLMLVVATLMFVRRGSGGDPAARLDRRSAPRLLLAGGGTGVLSGFFGIGGGFLIVPALMWAARLPILLAVGSSLLAVSAFGLTTATRYALSGQVEWTLALAFIGGGVLGGFGGAGGAARLGQHKGRLNTVFAGLIVLVAFYMIARGLS